MSGEIVRVNNNKVFENDFHKSPGLLGRVIKDDGLCGILNIPFCLAAYTFAGPVVAGLAVVLAVKDMVYFYNAAKSETFINKNEFWCLRLQSNEDEDVHDAEIYVDRIEAHNQKAFLLTYAKEQGWDASIKLVHVDERTALHSEYSKIRGEEKVGWVLGEKKESPDKKVISVKAIPVIETPTVIQPDPIPVTPTVIQGDYSPTMIQDTVEPAQGLELLDVPKYIVDNIYSYAVISPSGGGKGMLVSHVAREYKKRYPNRPVVLIDPKDDPKEKGYWEGVVDIWHRGNFRKMEIAEKSDWLNEGLDIIRGVAGEHLAIMDEATMTFGFANRCDRALANRLIDYITSTASGGNSSDEFLFLLGHSGNLGDYGISGNQMSSFRKIYIAPDSNEDSIIQLGSTNFAGGKFGEDFVKQIKDIASLSEVNRAVYVGTKNQWFPMAKLDNFSGYNRDERKFLQTQPEEKTVVQSTHTEVSLLTATNPHLDLFTDKLYESLTNAVLNGHDIELLKVENLLRHPNAIKLGLTAEDAKMALDTAKKRLKVGV